MIGETGEHVMGVLADDNGNPRSGYDRDYNSGFNGTVWEDGNDNSFSSGVTFPTSKYYDLYTSDNTLTACDGGMCYGHTISETAGWYSERLDYGGWGAYFITSDDPWIMRGGSWFTSTSFSSVNGVNGYDTSFRTSIVVGFGQ